MAELLYFAYGSNMLRQRLDARCPHIRLAGTAALADYRLTFDQYSPQDDSGKGGIEAAPGHVVHGVLWSLPLAELPALDRAESCGEAYERVQCEVIHADGRALMVTTYLPLVMRTGLRPWNWYRQLVIAGAEQQQLPAAYVAAIRQVPANADPQRNRPGRLTALDALTLGAILPDTWRAATKKEWGSGLYQSACVRRRAKSQENYVRLRSMLCSMALCLAIIAPAALAATAEQQLADTMAMLEQAIAIPTVKGNEKTDELANYLAQQLKEAGFDDADIEVIPVDDTAALTVRYSGSSDADPVLILGHMDVVPARFADKWAVEDPFQLTRKDGYLYGRGVADMKTEVVAVVQTFMRLKREGFVPERDLVLVLTGDEETTAASTQLLVEQFPDAAYAINAEGGGGMQSVEGEPIIFGVQSAEKEYGDFTLTATSPGGHSSQPHAPDNAIYRLSKALKNITEYQFPIQYDEVTRPWLETLGKHGDGLTSVALRTFAADPDNATAAAVIAADPAFVGQIQTTCVPTMLAAGQAPNALPQHATATVNCRIWPGVTGEEVMQQLVAAIDDASVEVTYAWEPQVAPSSPVKPELMQVVADTVHERYPHVDVTPMMMAAATDSAFFREAGIPSYGINPIYSKPDDSHAHGINERIQATEVAAALDFWYSLLPKLP